MANLNKVMLMGNLTRDPELKYTPKGTAVAELGLAINRIFNSENGEKREETTFVDVTLWGRTAEIAGEFLKKGRPVFIEGRLQLDTWDDKQTGQKRSKLKVVGEGLQLIGSRGGGDGGGSGTGGGGSAGGSGGGEYTGGAPKPAPAQPPKQRPPTDPDLEPEEDDIPF
jgi:single-strand DNA-binding protein